MGTVQCACGYSANIPDAFAGQKLRCPKCTNFIGSDPAPVPAPVGPEAPPEPVSDQTRVCVQCRRPMREDQMTCLHCGTRIQESASERLDRKAVLEHESSAHEVHDLGRKALIWSLISFACLPLGVLSIVFGVQSIKKSRDYAVPVNGLALGGIILGTLQLLGMVTWFLLFVFSIHKGMESSEKIGEKIFDGAPPPRPVPQFPFEHE
jgi:RNA polymerase subunit RPABC4/transcription elongation factor Spt4